MMRLFISLCLLTVACLASCAAPDNACLDGSSSCFTHTQGDDGDSTAAQTSSANANTAGQASEPNGPATITKTVVVDDFADPNVFTAGNNSLTPPQKQSDDHTMSVCELATDDRLELECATSGCYWYTMLAAQGSCYDLTQFTHIALTIQGAPGAGATMAVQSNSTDCTSTNFTGSQSVDLSAYTVFDNNPHGILVPLSAFPNVDKVHGRAVAFTTSPGVAVYLSNIQLVSVTYGQ